MVTVRNGKGRRMLEGAVAAGRVEILQEGGHGGRGLPSEGDRRPITMKTVAADSMVKSLTDPSFVPADAGAPPLVANLLASIISRTLPKGMEFGKYSIDYHYLRNQLFVEDRMGERRAARHVPAYAKALMRRYDADMQALRRSAARSSAGPAAGGGGADAGVAQAKAWAAAIREALLLF